MLPAICALAHPSYFGHVWQTTTAHRRCLNEINRVRAKKPVVTAHKDEWNIMKTSNSVSPAVSSCVSFSRIARPQGLSQQGLAEIVAVPKPYISLSCVYSLSCLFQCAVSGKESIYIYIWYVHQFRKSARCETHLFVGAFTSTRIIRL